MLPNLHRMLKSTALSTRLDNGEIVVNAVNSEEIIKLGPTKYLNRRQCVAVTGFLSAVERENMPNSHFQKDMLQGEQSEGASHY